MKIVGLMIVKNEVDIIKKTLDACSWLDELHIVDNGSTDGTLEILKSHPNVTSFIVDTHDFDESYFVPKLLGAVTEADWIVDIDADEVYDPKIREVLETCPPEYNAVGVEINYLINDRCYRQHHNWVRIYRNIPELFDFEHIKKLHRGKILIPKQSRKVYNSNINVSHYQLRNYQQAMAKYENYKKLDPNNEFQDSYEHLRKVAEMYRSGDFTGVNYLV